MDAFGFTKKKLCAQSSENQVKHIINWLSNFYQKLISNRTGPETMDLFFAEYHMVLNWVDILPLHKPKNHDTRLWIEFISDAIHMLRQTQGFSPRDYNLLEDIKTKDLEQDALFNPCIDYHIALDGLRSLFNIGTIFRTCDAAGFSSIILGNCPGSEHPSVQKTA
ncbi:MAG: hypothetical protein GY729_01050, partial [Desulfobacteraceae bacterium]|nr:hypothetical protein [Desulfobacteraceae bacterium]